MAKRTKVDKESFNYTLIKDEYRIQNNDNGAAAIPELREEIVDIPDSREIVQFVIEQPDSETNDTFQEGSGDEGYFHCTKCNRNLPHYNSYKEHQRMHIEEEGPLSCTICHQKFPNSKLLCLHILNHESKQNHECRVCGKKFRNNYTLSCHLIEGDPDDVIGKNVAGGLRKCYHCNRFLIDDWHLDRHMVKNHTNASTAGPSRPKRNISRKRNSTIDVTEIQLAQCDICNRYFNNEPLLARHIQQSHLG